MRVPEVEDTVLRLPIEIDGQRRDIGLSADALAQLAGALGGAVQVAVTPPPQPEAKGVVAPIAGLLTRWLAEDGATVEKDQPVAVMEAMKMEMTLTADRSGVLHQKVQPGAQVTEGSLLADLNA